ncbi:hypothetical protein [Eikenella corrodens]|uniref:Uncharacterized protein n=1 Tax=Eikenella corrodens TaxID=539 RepID=A0A3S9SJL0_EIKCO|nr:hypothetical protein [Eikenella corrodens]AZR59723.1 hypothetical protein ELB75_06625 [Eikenella corrodens]
MGEIELLAHIIKWRDEFSADVRVLKIDADIFVRLSSIRILLSLLLRKGYLKNVGNDEVVLEMELSRATLQCRVDVSDSLGRYYYSELNLNQYSVVSPCRNVCTVFGSPPCPDFC